MSNRNEMQQRGMTTKFNATRAQEENGKLIIAGYFATFNAETELWKGAFEEIAPGAFSDTLQNDIRGLVNHDTTLVLGRNKAGTLLLREDSIGLYGEIEINPNDSDAVNLYERVKRGDVDQCSFGFNILQESEMWREDGTVKWTLIKVDLHEVSVCTFPAYEQTGVQARHDQVEQYKLRMVETKKEKLKERMKQWH